MNKAATDYFKKHFQVTDTPVYGGRKEDMSVSSTLQHCVASKRDYFEMAGAQGECNTP